METLFLGGLGKRIFSKISGRKLNQAGVIYAAFGEKFVAEAIQSAISFKKFHSNFPITLISDTLNPAPIFDNYIFLDPPGNGFEKKIKAIIESPYFQTLYVDTDTIFVDTVDELFSQLEHFDLLAAIEHGRPIKYRVNQKLSGLMELNTGVLAFNKRSKVIKTFKAWSKIYANRKKIDFHDQTSLSLAMLGRGLALFPLPVDYNFRANQGQLLFGEVKIIRPRARLQID